MQPRLKVETSLVEGAELAEAAFVRRFNYAVLCVEQSKVVCTITLGVTWRRDLESIIGSRNSVLNQSICWCVYVEM